MSELKDARIGTLKGLTSIRRYLVDAQKAAMTSIDEIENLQYTAGPAITSVDGAEEQIENTVKAVQGIATYLTKAIQLSEAAKAALRQINIEEDQEGTSDIISADVGPIDASAVNRNPAPQPSVASRRYASRYNQRDTYSNATPNRPLSLASRRMQARKRFLGE